MQIHRWICKWINRWIDIWLDRWIDRWKDRWIDRWIHRWMVLGMGSILTCFNLINKVMFNADSNGQQIWKYWSV